MSKDLHRQAETLMANADSLRAQGRNAEAAQLYHNAAELELAAFEHIPHDRPRTRGVIGISTVALYRRAATLGETPTWFDQALRVAYSVLGSGGLPEFAEDEITSLADQLRREQIARKNNRTISDHGFGILLHGAEIYPGVAPVDTVLYKLKQFVNLFTRVGELIEKRPLRKAGSASAEISRVCVPLIGQPTTGSFQFDLRFDGPYQLSMFDNISALNAKTLVDTSFSLFDECASGNFGSFYERVNSDLYAPLLLRMVRNIAPSSSDVNRIDIVRLGTTEQTSTTLTPNVHRSVQSEIRRGQQSDPDEREQIGILRALDLNKGTIRLDKPTEQVGCFIREVDSFEDLFGPYVNRRVRVSGVSQRRGGRRVFVVNDIAEAESMEVGL